MIDWVTAVYFASFMVISVYAVALLAVIVRYRRYRPPPIVDISRVTPDVTVQLPLYNPDSGTLVRCLNAMVAMRYPREHLQIQVLDDSSRVEAVELIGRECASRGIEVLHRDTREGYRAGAFAASVPSVRGEYIVIVNVDCVPPVDFLEKIVGTIHADPGVGYVMSNHVYHNRYLNGQTKITSVILDMGVMNMNGLSMLTGGGVVVRKKAIIDAGGWQGDTICDDYDTGARILSAGYRSVFLRDEEFPCEAPESLREYRRTIERWARASGQYMRKDLGRIIGGKINAFDKFLLLTLSTGFVQMLAGAINLLAVLILIWLNAIPGPQYAAIWSVVTVTGFALYAYYYHVTKFRALPMSRHFRDLFLAVVVGYGSAFFVTYNLVGGILEGRASRAVMRANSALERNVVDILFIAASSAALVLAVYYMNGILAAYMLLNLVGIGLIRTRKP